MLAALGVVDEQLRHLVLFGFAVELWNAEHVTEEEPIMVCAPSSYKKMIEAERRERDANRVKCQSHGSIDALGDAPRPAEKTAAWRTGSRRTVAATAWPASWIAQRSKRDSMTHLTPAFRPVQPQRRGCKGRGMLLVGDRCPVWERYPRAKAAATATISCDNRQHLMNT
jgi:hypothetical protein